MGHQKSIIAATSICLRRRLQPGLQQPSDPSGVVPHLPAARALLAAALKCFLGEMFKEVQLTLTHAPDSSDLTPTNPTESRSSLPRLVREKPRRDSGRFTLNSANLSRKSREAEMSS